MNTQQVAVRDSEEISSGLPTGYEAGGSLAVSLARAEIDQQIVTARALPRSISRAVGNITTLATLDETSAEECIYALPRAGKAIKGPSIRLAEIIAGQWGNCRVGARVVHVDRYEKFIEAEGVFHDLETNTATTSRVRRRISNKRGELLQEDMIIVTGNAACAIAKRNAILGGVPKAVWRKAYDAVESVIAGDIKTLAERRPMALKAFAAFGVKPEQIFEAIGVQGLDDITLDHMATLTGMRSSLKSGESTVEEMFPIKPTNGDRPKDLKGRLDKLAGEPEKPAEPSHDPDTSEILDNEHTSTPRSEQSNGRGEAAADGTVSVERRVEPPTPRDLEGEPAPDPQQASGGKPSDVSRDEAGNGGGAGGQSARPISAARQSRGASGQDASANGTSTVDVAQAAGSSDAPKGMQDARQGPQTGGGTVPGVSPPATSTKPLSAADAEILSDLMEIGAAKAREGAAALSKWLDGLEPGQRALLPNNLVFEWIGIARAVQPPKPSAERSFPTEEAKRARIAEIKREGPAKAQEGEVALMNYFEALRDSREADLVSSVIKSAWRETAKGVRR